MLGFTEFPIMWMGAGRQGVCLPPAKATEGRGAFAAEAHYNSSLMTNDRDISEILHLLDWYLATGVDAALQSEPIDWLLRGAKPPGQGFELPGRDVSISSFWQ